MHVKLTIFTATYNRAGLLSRLHDSLVAQTSRDFTWYIVDDGSIDQTAEMIKQWQSETDFRITYRYVVNGGKQRAHNLAVEAASTELFLCVDSDDYLLENAVEVMLSEWQRVSAVSTVAGMVALRGVDPGTPLGTWMPYGIERSTLSDLYARHRFRGDTALLFRVNVLRDYPFQVAKGESFIGESSVYNRIDRDYTMALLNRIVYIAEYQSGGYTARSRSLISANPRGYAQLNYDGYLASTTLRGRLSATLKYLVGAQLAGAPFGLSGAPNRRLAAAMLPLAILARRCMFR